MSDTTTLPNELSPYLRVEFAQGSRPSDAAHRGHTGPGHCEKSQCSIREFVSVVERDAKLATDILGMSNSAMFWTGGARSSACSSRSYDWDFASVET